MEEKKLSCSILTPMFSYGANTKAFPEVRTSEIKGMMRYVYRIICPTCLKSLANDEAEIFGGAAGNGSSDKRHASPVRLQVRSNHLSTESQPLLLHNKKGDNPKLRCLKSESFDLIVRLNPSVSKAMPETFPKVDLNWYTDFIKLTFLLCGLGKRSRKGRGSIKVGDCLFNSKEETLKWIYSALNKVTLISSNHRENCYQYQEMEIQSNCCDESIKRPLIQKIRIGIELSQDEIENYLKAIDQASHDLKDTTKNIEQKSITGNCFKNPRFASPLLISLIQTKEGIYPLYVFVKAVYNKKELDSKCEEREGFIQNVERKLNRRINH